MHTSCRVYTCKRNESDDHSVVLGLTCQVEVLYTCQYPKGGELCLSRLKPGETLVEGRCDTDVQIVRQTWVQGRKTNRTTQQLVPPEVSLRIAVTRLVLSCKANDQRHRGQEALDLFSNFEWARSYVSLLNITDNMGDKWAIFGKQNWR